MPLTDPLLVNSLSTPLCYGEIEHIQSGVCWQCNTLAAVFQLLQRAAEGPSGGIVPDADADRET